MPQLPPDSVQAVEQAGETGELAQAAEQPAKSEEFPRVVERFAKNGGLRLVGNADGKICAYDISRDCLIWQCVSVTEPVVDLLLQEESWTIYARGRSGTWYKVDAADVLAEYDSKDAAGQRERYRQIGERELSPVSS